MDKVHYFSDDPWATSSGYALVWKDAVYPTAAHLYQALKFRFPYFWCRVREARSAHEAKKVAHRLLETFPGADVRGASKNKQKLARMERVLRLKLSQYPELKEKLVALYGTVLVADVPHPFWGRGKKGEGENQLGRLWMKLQAELIAKTELRAAE